MSELPWVLGLSSSHNGGACLMHGDQVVVAIQEERLLRQKRSEHPGCAESLAIRYCLDHAQIQPSDLSLAVLCAAGSNRVRREDVSLNPLLQTQKHGIRMWVIPHHLGHAFGAFASSGFSESSILVVDGNGSPWDDLEPDERGVVKQDLLSAGAPPASIRETISLYRASGTRIEPLEKHVQHYEPPDYNAAGMPLFGSLGDMYGFIGYQIFGSFFDGPGKVMGLAPYGRPVISCSEFLEWVEGSFRFKDTLPNMYRHNDRWPARKEEYQNLAASVQAALESALLCLVHRLSALSGSRRLCYAGGVALNSVANERLIQEGLFDDVFIMPAAEDSGTALGAAYYGYWRLSGRSVWSRHGRDSCGRTYTASEVESSIAEAPGVETVETSDVTDYAAGLLAEGHIVGWFQGGSELGPRALGQRSILCDPRRPEMKDALNRRVKFREGFRPFAPAVLRERAHEWFEIDAESADSPFMLRVLRFREDRAPLVPAVVHVDGTGRAQTVARESAPQFYDLVARFGARTGVPLVLNTSFNIAGEPIVETPRDALWCFLYTDMDYCVLENFVVRKTRQQSILDFSVKLTVESVMVSCRPKSGKLAGEHESGVLNPVGKFVSVPIGRADELDDLATRARWLTVRLITNTIWGRIMHGAAPGVLPLLRAIDGVKTARALLAEMQTIFLDLSEAEFLRTLSLLRRARVIAFGPGPRRDAEAERGAPEAVANGVRR